MRWVAFLVAAALLAGCGGGSRRLTIVLTDARGLVPGAEVRVAGLKVGSVDRVGLGRDGLPHVALTVQRSVDLRAGARAALRLASLSGERNRYVALDPGAGPPLPGGATLGVGRTRSPVEIDDVLSALDVRTRADVRGVLRGLRAATAGRAADLAATLRAAPDALGAAADALRDVDGDGAALRSLVRDARGVSGALAAGRATVGASVDRVAGLLQRTAGRARALDATVAGLPAALRSADGALGRARRTLPLLDTLAQAARPGTAQLAAAAPELERAAIAAAPVLAEARRITPAQLRAVTPLLRTATPVLRRLAPVLARLNPMLDEARVRLPDFFSFFSNWADFTANYDANGHAARVGIVLPPPDTKVASPDRQEPGLLAKPYLRTPGALESDPWTHYQDSFVAGSG
ncbi:MAG: phospholipid/cholesterol/gamma-HCH transport system substrate-binding protein [Solirubrobacteraceae bacterium]|nr:phospholipid/cholesterol/gamma-HCH transport system substrate-binding protein [Solirubrobacteraceae bacterium]